LESLFQDDLEAKGYRSPTWRILRALQATIKANVVIGEPDHTRCNTAQVKRVFITNVKGTFLGMSESEEASKRR